MLHKIILYYYPIEIKRIAKMIYFYKTTYHDMKILMIFIG